MASGHFFTQLAMLSPGGVRRKLCITAVPSSRLTARVNKATSVFAVVASCRSCCPVKSSSDHCIRHFFGRPFALITKSSSSVKFWLKSITGYEYRFRRYSNYLGRYTASYRFTSFLPTDFVSPFINLSTTV